MDGFTFLMEIGIPRKQDMRGRRLFVEKNAGVFSAVKAMKIIKGKG